MGTKHSKNLRTNITRIQEQKLRKLRNKNYNSLGTKIREQKVQKTGNKNYNIKE
jgi:hypothetical protein